MGGWRGGREQSSGAKASHRPTPDRGQMQPRAPGDRPPPPLQGRPNKTAALERAPTAPSWPAPAAEPINLRESLFAAAFNRLLQQNRHKADVAGPSTCRRIIISSGGKKRAGVDVHSQ